MTPWQALKYNKYKKAIGKIASTNAKTIQYASDGLIPVVPDMYDDNMDVSLELAHRNVVGDKILQFSKKQVFVISLT